MYPTPKGQLMPAPRTFTPARIVALALIAILVGGLAYLRFAPDSDAVSVPEGAKAGDLILEQCDYATEDGAYAADCGTLVVPENRADPQSRLIALPVTRIRARSANPAEPIFRLQGGPGISNMTFERASRFADDRDVVLVGYRGVDGSVRLDCPEVESAVKHSTDVLGEKSFRAFGDAFRSCAARLTDDGVDVAGYSVTQRVDDLEAARVALGYDRINLVSESAGTRYAMVYAWRYPKGIHRSVMIAANPPGHYVWDAKTTDEQIGRYAGLCSTDESCSKRTDDLAASIGRTAADMPDRWLFLPIKDGNVRVASLYGLMETTSESAPLNAPMTLDSWLSASDGDASGFWFSSLLADLALPKAFVWGEYAAIARDDARAAREYFSSGWQERDSNLGVAATAFGWGGGRLVDGWPASPDENTYSRVRPSNVETLLVGGELDFAAPPQWATRDLLPHLPNGHQVLLPGFGHSTSFWTDQPQAGTRLINTFVESGRIDDSLYKPQTVDFTPDVTHTALAKGIAGTMVGLALLTVLSLLLMARRVRRRGRFGRKASATLRTVYPIVLGLGGWFVGVLIVITTMPGVPLDDELLAMLSVGLPVGLGIYLAWVRRDSAQSKAVGLAAAAAGALAGAWLGFHATVDVLALVTAIAGAVAGANLTLILLDMSQARSVGDPLATRQSVDARPPNLEPA
jgi:pimeloyl-ACP methyl ester carboxylesterase